MKERFIFDLDGTILQGDYKEVAEYFSSIMPEEYSKKLNSSMVQLLDIYERTFPKYDKTTLSKFLSKSLGFKITENMVSTWIEITSNIESTVYPDAIEALEYLKSKNKSIVVLTNWFRESQVQRLQRQLLLPYFDQIYAGDTFLKPSSSSYKLAAGSYPIEKCIMIGDSLEKDVLGPQKIGMDAIYCHHNCDEEKDKVKSLIKIKEMY